MVAIENLILRGDQGVLNGLFLVAMPGMHDKQFERSVVFICAHSSEGAMGFILNTPHPMNFLELVENLDLNEQDKRETGLSGNKITTTDPSVRQKARNFPVQVGGPVEPGRGFVLHTCDYSSRSTMRINEDLCLTATVDILRAIRDGRGPERGMMLLGYAGWGEGQLENEISANAWLTCPSSSSIILDADHATKYDRVMASMGITPALLSTEAGHA